MKGPNGEVQIDTSLQSWIFNAHTVVKSPLTIIFVFGLLVTGAFVEIAPRKSLILLDNTVGSLILFILPLLTASFFDWATGLLAAVICLIVFARLQKYELSEGFLDEVVTEIIPSPKRWFVEKILGETPIAISSDRIKGSNDTDIDSRTSSSSSMSSSATSDGSSHK